MQRDPTLRRPQYACMSWGSAEILTAPCSLTHSKISIMDLKVKRKSLISSEGGGIRTVCVKNFKLARSSWDSKATRFAFSSVCNTAPRGDEKASEMVNRFCRQVTWLSDHMPRLPLTQKLGRGSKLEIPPRYQLRKLALLAWSTTRQNLWWWSRPAPRPLSETHHVSDSISLRRGSRVAARFFRASKSEVWVECHEQDLPATLWTGLHMRIQPSTRTQRGRAGLSPDSPWICPTDTPHVTG